MAKKDTSASENNPQNQQQNAAPLIINTQFLKDFSFESPNAPSIFVEMKHAPEININLDVKAGKISEDNNIFKVSLIVNAEASYEGKTAFICETEYCAIATLNIPAEHIEQVLLVEIPKYLFPFSRKIIASATSESGFSPVMLQPVDFLALYLNKKQQNANNNADAATEVK